MVGSDIDGYTARFHELARLVPHMVTPESQHVNHYIWGLAPEIKPYVTSSEHAIIQGAVSMANCLTTNGIKDGLSKKKENARNKKRSNDQNKNRGRDDRNKRQRNGGNFALTVPEQGQGQRQYAGMDWLSKQRAKIVCYEKIVQISLSNEDILEVHGERLPPSREVEFCMDLILRAMPVAKSPYRLAPMKMQELRFIANFLKILRPLTLLTQRNKRFEWSDEKKNTFQTLIDMLCDAPIMALPKGTYDFAVYYDASNQGNGYHQRDKIQAKPDKIEHETKSVEKSKVKKVNQSQPSQSQSKKQSPELTLRVNNEAVTFNLDQTSRYSANYNDMTANRIDIIDMACKEYSQEVLGFFDVIAMIFFSRKSMLSSLLKMIHFHQKLITLIMTRRGTFILFKAFLNNDPSLPPPNQGMYLPQVRKELKIYEAKNDKSLVDEPPEVELKDLPPHLEYIFLEGNDKLPVIIAKDLSVKEKTTLIKVLKSHKQAISWKLFDIKGIDPEFYTHKILIEDDFEPAIKKRPHLGILTERLPTVACLLAYAMHRARSKGVMAIFNDMIEKRWKSSWTTSWFLGIHLELVSPIWKRCLSGNGIEVDKAKVDVIAKLPHPTTVKCIHNFLGHADFYQEFIQDFSKIARSMTHLLEKDTLFFFSNERIEAFQTLKKKLTEAPILFAPDWDLPFKLMYDASDFAIGLELPVPSSVIAVCTSAMTSLQRSCLSMVSLTVWLPRITLKQVGSRSIKPWFKKNLSKLKTRWSGPFTITQVFPYVTVKLSQTDGPNFKVNGHRLKHYFGEDIPKMVVLDLQTFLKDH
uniref:Reverse transcriptase/retrotransposon-derived protein RNase H-like domain-containing protein n=1 Tax=Tanacetum cinerariifolium TaxID=118510 RepID=A0A6L2KZ53_TANCI|nr:hypothetical protein [Tanacetum cinerariifolium]GEU54080.1 hypothetical protein [Tanacetum cinerariifolium]